MFTIDFPDLRPTAREFSYSEINKGTLRFEKFPVKDPRRAGKRLPNTFLNAMTYPDKTVSRQAAMTRICRT